MVIGSDTLWFEFDFSLDDVRLGAWFFGGKGWMFFEIGLLLVNASVHVDWEG
jgi:hypothetical protein